MWPRSESEGFFPGPRELLLFMAVDVAVDGGDWGDGRLPEELEHAETWSGLLGWLDRGYLPSCTPVAASPECARSHLQDTKL
ncbi:hypothetical protein AK812_SmicGene14907 [Symbiodinium microadriaticum]|uniref:Uncharacterized protein n=1 Tax=Symbiodinium microadriaticum TaxID=2951 RepID=A0A1Q9E4B6_SYMMI|nr:hypothetical protein AK812_SmicGene14907 [Symbiodinium microadriaticum]